ncbi:hypothetical protein TSAR_009302 [Trichomalopsis sarcophagae]|uniref:Uncharacterized protein n=1 Tax=Trichomalopsis sarcophagae TaxID=543379 RepID=A0A232FE84_9HYME|nr:hypothetical protein TSAR_009302 [Trichomalopsis sarcophagae]
MCLCKVQFAKVPVLLTNDFGLSDFMTRCYVYTMVRRRAIKASDRYETDAQKYRIPKSTELSKHEDDPSVP